MHNVPCTAIMASRGRERRRYGSWTSQQMEEALQAIKSGLGLNETARQHGIPRATLQRHMFHKNKYANDSTKFLGRPTVFSDEMEEELVEYLLNIDRMMFGLTRKECMKLAFQVAEKNNLKHNFNRDKQMAGKDWINSFFARHKDICLRQPQSTTIARATGFNKGAVNQFFICLESVIDKHKFHAQTIYNMDETSLSTVAKSQKIISEKGKHQTGIMSSAERGTNTTGVFCVSASGHWVPPMLLYKRKRLNEQLCAGAPNGTHIECNETGWMKKDTFLKWLKHFIDVVKPTPETPVLLLLDGHSSHTKNIEAIDLARSRGVVMLSFPPHCTHRLQPLDVAFFRPLKVFYSQAINTWLRNHPGRSITTFQVAELLNTAFIKAATMQNAVQGFAKCGLWPCRRDVFNDGDFYPCEAMSAPATDHPSDVASKPATDYPSDMASEPASDHPPDVASAPVSDHPPDVASAPVSDHPPEAGTDPDHTSDIENHHTSRHSKEPFFTQGSIKVVHTNPDGRCLFRSVSIGMDQDLQVARRDGNGTIKDALLKTREQLKADKLRADTVNFMMEHIGDYEGLDNAVLNADQPEGRYRFGSITERLIAMSKPTTMPGEAEMFALSTMLCKPVIVVDTQLRCINKYNLDKFSGLQVLYVQYVSLGADIGHYNCVLFSPGKCPGTEPEWRLSADHASNSQPARDHQPPSNHQPESNSQPTCNPQPETTPQPSSNPQPETTPQPSSNPQPETTPQPSSNPQPETTPQPSSNPQPASDFSTPRGKRLPTTRKRVSPEDIAPLPRKRPSLMKRLSNRSHPEVLTSNPYKNRLAAQLFKAATSSKDSARKTVPTALKAPKAKPKKTDCKKVAPPDAGDWTCSLCCESRAEDMIQCQNENCKRWVHVACTDVPSDGSYICELCRD